MPTTLERFEGVRYVRWHGKYYHLQQPVRADRHGRVELVELQDTSRGQSVNPIDVWPAEPEQVEAINWWLKKWEEDCA